MATYSNVPPIHRANSDQETLKIFNNYYSANVEIAASTYDMVKNFFTSKGFELAAAESIAMVLITQSKKDGFNPIQLLDNLKGLTSVEISGLVSEIINFNRYKTSYLGYVLEQNKNSEIHRNILP